MSDFSSRAEISREPGEKKVGADLCECAQRTFAGARVLAVSGEPFRIRLQVDFEVDWDSTDADKIVQLLQSLGIVQGDLS